MPKLGWERLAEEGPGASGMWGYFASLSPRAFLRRGDGCWHGHLWVLVMTEPVLMVVFLSGQCQAHGMPWPHWHLSPLCKCEKRKCLLLVSAWDNAGGTVKVTCEGILLSCMVMAGTGHAEEEQALQCDTAVFLSVDTLLSLPWPGI